MSARTSSTFMALGYASPRGGDDSGEQNEASAARKAAQARICRCGKRRWSQARKTSMVIFTCSTNSCRVRFISVDGARKVCLYLAVLFLRERIGFDAGAYILRPFFECRRIRATARRTKCRSGSAAGGVIAERANPKQRRD